MIKGAIEKPTINIVVNTERLSVFFLHQKQDKDTHFCHL